MLFNSFHQFGLLFCGWLDFSSEKISLFRFLVNYSKIYFKINADLNYQEINEVEDSKIAEFFDDLISNEQNDYIKIVINNGNLEIMEQSPDEVMISFQKEDEEEDPDLSGKNAVKRIIKDVKAKIKRKKSKSQKKEKMQKIRLVPKIIIKKEKLKKKKKSRKNK